MMMIKNDDDDDTNPKNVDSGCPAIPAKDSR